MRRMITFGPLLILALLSLPVTTYAEDRSDWRPPQTEPVESADAVAKFDTASGGNFSVNDAQALLEQAGYDGISELEQVNPFVWRAKGVRDGTAYALTVDFSGNIVGITTP